MIKIKIIFYFNFFKLEINFSISSDIEKKNLNWSA